MPNQLYIKFFDYTKVNALATLSYFNVDKADMSSYKQPQYLFNIKSIFVLIAVDECHALFYLYDLRQAVSNESERKHQMKIFASAGTQTSDPLLSSALH